MVTYAAEAILVQCIYKNMKQMNFIKAQHSKRCIGVTLATRYRLILRICEESTINEELSAEGLTFRMENLQTHLRQIA